MDRNVQRTFLSDAGESIEFYPEMTNGLSYLGTDRL